MSRRDPVTVAQYEVLGRLENRRPSRRDDRKTSLYNRLASKDFGSKTPPLELSDTSAVPPGRVAYLVPYPALRTGLLSPGPFRHSLRSRRGGESTMADRPGHHSTTSTFSSLPAFPPSTEPPLPVSPCLQTLLAAVCSSPATASGKWTGLRNARGVSRTETFHRAGSCLATRHGRCRSTHRENAIYR
jgi:hypothetical protein